MITEWILATLLGIINYIQSLIYQYRFYVHDFLDTKLWSTIISLIQNDF